MDTAVDPANNSEQDLHLLTDWTAVDAASRRPTALSLSVLAHVFGLIFVLLLPKDFLLSPPPRVAFHVTPLVAPKIEKLYEPTQPAPNKGKISKEINSQSVPERPEVQVPRAPESTARPAARRPAPPALPPAPPEPPKQVAEAPPVIPPAAPPPVAKPVEQAALPIPQPAAPPPPLIQTEEKPKIAFENPNAQPLAQSQGVGKIAAPSSSVSEAVRGIARGGTSGGITVGDAGLDVGGIGEALRQPPSPGKTGSALELLSDPMGVDFRPYLVRVLANVRRNWFAIMPESVRMGRRGRTILQFSIDRQGKVPKLVIVTGSGTDALDRAAVAGVSASNPFPPLPAEFKGDQIRLQFVFSYNQTIR
ncbi:MAG: TonB family protein [Bryobacteraceae bacterium]